MLLIAKYKHYVVQQIKTVFFRAAIQTNYLYLNIYKNIKKKV